MRKKIIIAKFGGASLKNTASFLQALKIMRREKEKPDIVIVSAIDKGTNALEKIAEGFIKNRPDKCDEGFASFRSYNEPIINELFGSRSKVRRDFEEIMHFLRAYIINGNGCNSFKMMRDQIMPMGEIVSSMIMSNYLTENFYSNKEVQATNFLKANMDFGCASILREDSLKMMKHSQLIRCIEKGLLVVTQGFFARAFLRTANFRLDCKVTLGREGSDFSAAVIASLLTELGIEVEEVVLWKDVKGVGNQNPKTADGPVKYYKHLSFDKFQDMIDEGGSAHGLVHPKTLKELEIKKIPLHIKDFWNPDLPGTIIS